MLGPSVTEHPEFHQLAKRLLATPDIELTIASVRADSLTEEILATLKQLEQRSVTIAIESGSERLRSIMKKNLTEAEILHAVELIDKSGLSGVKFYGIVGLPHELQADLDETVRLLTMLKKKHRRLKFVFGVSSFVPKAQTPFQWDGRDQGCVKKLEYLRKNLAKIGIEVRPESLNWSGYSGADIARRQTSKQGPFGNSPGTGQSWGLEALDAPGATVYSRIRLLCLSPNSL